MNDIPAAPSSALKVESSFPVASNSAESVPVMAPVPVAAPVPMMASVPVVASVSGAPYASSSNASASVASGPPYRNLRSRPQYTESPDYVHGNEGSDPTITSATASAPVPSIAQAALTLATALRDADPSISSESLVSEIVTAFIRAGPKSISTTTPVTDSTGSMMPAMNLDVQPKDLENRIDLAIANVNESLLKLTAEQKRLENLVNENTHRTKTRLANMKSKIAELDKAASEMI